MYYLILSELESSYYSQKIYTYFLSKLNHLWTLKHDCDNFFAVIFIIKEVIVLKTNFWKWIWNRNYFLHCERFPKKTSRPWPFPLKSI